MNTPVQLPKAKRQIGMKYWHEAIIDDMLAYPISSLGERSQRLGYSKKYLGSIMNSDMFKVIYEGRRAQYNELLQGALALKVASVAQKGLEVMEAQLEKKRDAIPFRDVSTATLGILGAAGMGPKPQGSLTNVQVNVQQPAPLSVSAEVLEGAREKLRAVEQGHLIAEKPVEIASSRLDGPFALVAKPTEAD